MRMLNKSLSVEYDDTNDIAVMDLAPLESTVVSVQLTFDYFTLHLDSLERIRKIEFREAMAHLPTDFLITSDTLTSRSVMRRVEHMAKPEILKAFITHVLQRAERDERSNLSIILADELSKLP